jgi:CheY-like chemotaxis protein
MGIAAHDLPRVFEMFYQGNAKPDDAQGGLGLGLALVHQLVGLHAGSIEAHSAGPGKGSEFVVRLPTVATPSQSPASEARTRPDPTARPRRILVVDDNRDAADSLGMLLEVLGADTRVVYDGAAALRALPEHRPEILFLDLGMPEMDGEEVARRVRAAPEFRDTVLIAMTGWGQEEDRRRSESAGFDFHLVKPADIDVLHGLLSSLRGAAARRAAAGAERE